MLVLKAIYKYCFKYPMTKPKKSRRVYITKWINISYYDYEQYRVYYKFGFYRNK